MKVLGLRQAFSILAILATVVFFCIDSIRNADRIGPV